MKIKRLFTKDLEGQDVFDTCEWKQINISIKHGSKTIFQIDNAEFPEHFSIISCKIIAAKYFRMTGIPTHIMTVKGEKSIKSHLIPEWISKSIPTSNSQFVGEFSLKQVLHRLAGYWTYWGFKCDYFDTEEDAKAFYDESLWMMLYQMAAPNTPQWFNAGLHWAYGITGKKKGFYRVDPATNKMMRTSNFFEFPAVHACSILSIEDTLFDSNGIYDNIYNEARMFCTGGGVGSNFSKIRAIGELLSTGSEATGLMSFLEILDRSASVVRSGSSQRRSSKMVIVDADHPEIEKFIQWKEKEEKKVEALIKGGFSSGFEGEAYKTVSGQNSNNSIMLTKKFINAIKNNDNWDLIARTTGKVLKTIKARELMDKMVKACFNSGDPGFLFKQTMNDWNTCPADGEIVSTNPCFHPDTLITTPTGLTKISNIYYQNIQENGATTDFDICTAVDGLEINSATAFPTGIRDIIRIEASCGLQLKITPEHKMLIINNEDKEEWIEGKDLKQHDKLIIQPPNFNVNFKIDESTDNLNRLIGWLSANGCYINNHPTDIFEIQFGKYDNEGLKRIKETLTQRNIPYTEYIKKNRDWKYLLFKTNDELKSLQLPKFISTTNRMIPDSILSDKKVWLSYLAGYIASDKGSITENHHKTTLTLYVANRDIANQFQVMLFNMGISNYYSLRKREYTNFVIKNKRDKTEKLNSQTKRYTHMVKISGLNLRKLKSILPKIANTMKSNRMANIESTVIDEESVVLYPIRSINHTGQTSLVFDINEPNTQSLIANGMLAHNCAEWVFLDDTACNLASINLEKFADKLNFKTTEFIHACKHWAMILDISNNFAQLATHKLAYGVYNYRAIGLGFTGLGGMLMKAGIPYDSEKACDIAGGISALMTASTYSASSAIAETLGAFPRFKDNKKEMLRVLKNHARCVGILSDPLQKIHSTPQRLNHNNIPNKLWNAIKKEWENVLKCKKFRNAFATLIAPTGTISFVMDTSTTGIEPDFSLIKIKELSGGGSMKMVNNSVQTSLHNIGYNKKEIDDIMIYMIGNNTLDDAKYISKEFLLNRGFTKTDVDLIESKLDGITELRFAFNKLSQETIQNIGVYQKPHDFNIFRHLGISKQQYIEDNKLICGHGTVEGAPHIKNKHLKIFDCAIRSGAGKRFIPWQAHVKIVAAVQPFISGSSSKTINMPNECSEKDILSAIELANNLGVKCISIYRDGSKKSQPLHNIDTNKILWWDPTLARGVHLRGLRRRPPKKRELIAHEITINSNGKKHKVIIKFGEYENGELCEIWLEVTKQNPHFFLAMKWFARALSNAIQYGQPLKEIIGSFIAEQGGPSGRTDHSNITSCESIPDLLVKLISMEYLGDITYCRNKPSPYDLRCSKINDNEKLEIIPIIGPVEMLEGADKCPVCGSSNISWFPCPTCECGTSLGGCSM